MLVVRLVSTVVVAAATCQTFYHPGILHTALDLKRIASKVAAEDQPWLDGWEKLTANSHAQATWSPRPQTTVYRGSDGVHAENYQILYGDIAAAYDLAVRWHVEDNSTYADAAINILSAWASTLVNISGTSDKYLASGLYGYQFANAGELMRDYAGWDSDDFDSFVSMMTNVFYPMNHAFITEHNGAAIDHYWSNWDLSNIASMVSIGILADNTTMYNEGLEYFKTGAGNGAITNAIWKIWPNVSGETLGQIQEAGRDQGHTTLDVGLLGVIAQTTYNQGDDMFKYSDNRILAGAEYAAKYNMGYNVPYAAYNNSDNVNQVVISNSSRGTVDPVWELVYNHYGARAHLNVTYIKLMRDYVVANGSGSEGGGGNYSPNSGGYDFLGFGTLMYTL